MRPQMPSFSDFKNDVFYPADGVGSTFFFKFELFKGFDFWLSAELGVNPEVWS